MRTPLIVGNWKMNLNTREATNLVKSIFAGVRGLGGIEVVVCPSYTALSAVSSALEKTNIGLGAQNMYTEPEGAFTGEISPLMLKDLGCRFVILGHSERRAVFGEKDALINKKVLTALKYSIVPIVCVGETLEEHERRETEQVIQRQFEGTFKDLTATDWKRTVIAYEPVWAIGTGRTAMPSQAEEAHAFIRELLASRVNEVADEVRILYGGSIKPDNFGKIMAQPNVDGGLVGGASLKAESFIEIVKSSLPKNETSGIKS
ncbi:MAG: triose-phosphate isomerase [Candidatus Omnitrophica bacterium]|nr:triose-phosphate isomerase [Candidatus Omnitrophota bacterium]